MFFSAKPLRPRIGADSSVSVSLAKQLQEAAAKDTAAAEARKSETNAQVKKYGTALAPFTGGASLVLAGVALAALDAMSAVSNLITGDPNSKEWQDRAINAYGAAFERGWIPHMFTPDTQFAKDFALYLESGNRSFDSFFRGGGGGWAAALAPDFQTAWKATRTNPIVQEAAKRALGAWDSGDVCIERTRAGVSGYRALPTFYAAIASVKFGIPLATAIATAYATPLAPDGEGLCIDCCQGGRKDRPHAGESDLAGWTFAKDCWTRLSKGKAPVASSSSSSSSSVGTVGTAAVAVGGAYLAYKYLFPLIKSKLA